MTKITKIVEVEIKVTPPSEIEKTKRAMYGCLERMKRAGKHRKLTAEFEDRLEEHLEELRKVLGLVTGVRNSFERVAVDYTKMYVEMKQERDAIQLRLHAIDHAFCEQSNTVSRMADEIDRHKVAINIAGEELIRVQGIARQHLDDCRSAEKLSDDLSEKLTHATTVIGQQEQLIAGQRSAIANMHAELTHSRTIRKALQCAQGAFRSMDEALHGSHVWSAQKALADDVVDAEFQA